jgi:hypothetical protein
MLIYNPALVVVELSTILLFFTNKSCKICLGPMLPQGSRSWQLIYPHSMEQKIDEIITELYFLCFNQSLNLYFRQ